MFRRNNWYTINLILLLLLLIEISVESAQIRVENKGGFVARVLIRYQNSNGEELLYNSGGFPLLQTSVINIDNAAKSIVIEVQMYTFINSVKTIFKTTDSCPHTRCFVISGTLFQPGWNENCCQ